MSETLTYIDNYFDGTLSAAERSAFEKRCEVDENFAREVAFYIASRDALKNEMKQQRKKEFEELYRNLNTSRQGAVIRRIVPYVAAAAACVLIFFGWMMFFKPSDPQKLASAYISENFNSFSVPMGNAGADSLQTAVAALNEKDFARAEQILQPLTQNKDFAPDAFRYLGVLCLVNDRYDEALAHFDALSKYGILFANPGQFYKAVVLMKRSAPGDREAARTLLEEVVSKDLAGSREAQKWLSKM